MAFTIEELNGIHGAVEDCLSGVPADHPAHALLRRVQEEIDAVQGGHTPPIYDKDKPPPPASAM